MTNVDKTPEIQAAANAVAQAEDADILLYNGPIGRDWDRTVIFNCRKRRRRKNVLLFLVTAGGDPDAAYRISRCLQICYSKFSCCVPGYCKSAGTLVALGAQELVVSDNGEIGPIDVQMSKRDELWEMESGQVVMTSLTTLQEKAFLAFEHFFLTLKRRGRGSITLRTAAEVATKLTTGLFTSIYQQIDPKHVGEAGRAMAIAYQYGVRLRRKSKNFTLETLEQIVSGYPSHGFVIDRQEMRNLFSNVRSLSHIENPLFDALGNMACEPVGQDDDPVIEFLSDEAEEPTANADQNPTIGTPADAGPQPEQAAAAAGGSSS